MLLSRYYHVIITLLSCLILCNTPPAVKGLDRKTNAPRHGHTRPDDDFIVFYSDFWLIQLTAALEMQRLQVLLKVGLFPSGGRDQSPDWSLLGVLLSTTGFTWWAEPPEEPSPAICVHELTLANKLSNICL